MDKSLSLKVKSGFAWSMLGVFSGRLLQFIGDIILSRILAPEDFVAPVVGFKYATIEILREKETIFDSPTSGKYFVREWTVTDGEREERSGTFFKTMNEAENYVNEYQS